MLLIKSTSVYLERSPKHWVSPLQCRWWIRSCFILHIFVSIQFEILRWRKRKGTNSFSSSHIESSSNNAEMACGKSIFFRTQSFTTLRQRQNVLIYAALLISGLFSFGKTFSSLFLGIPERFQAPAIVLRSISRDLEFIVLEATQKVSHKIAHTPLAHFP